MWKSLFRIFRRFSRDRENRSNPWVRSGKAPHRGRGSDRKKAGRKRRKQQIQANKEITSSFRFLLCACVCVRVCAKKKQRKSQQEKEDRNENNNNLKQKQQQSSEKEKKQSAAYFGFRTVFDSQSTSPRGTVNFVFCYLLTPRSRTRRSIHQCQPCQIR